jgi:N-succinyldiaminopimelate aminotransferase
MKRGTYDAPFLFISNYHRFLYTDKMFNSRLDLLVDYPFQRLTRLLGDLPSGLADKKIVNMSIGEPQHRPPDFVAKILQEESSGWGKYPPMNGLPELRQTITQWLNKRYELKEKLLLSDQNVLPIAGSRGGLYQAAFIADNRDQNKKSPVILLPNPFYQVYAGAGLMAGAELYFMTSTKETNYLPNFMDIPKNILERTVLAYLCSPSNPEGAVANKEYLKNIVNLSRTYDFILAVDECYSEIYCSPEPPPGILQVVDDLHNIIIFNSLSKRSSAPGLRSGFISGDKNIISAFAKLNSYCGAAIPLPIQKASIALWDDESHVQDSLRKYQQKIALTERFFGHWTGFKKADGGFFLWLPVEDSEKAALLLWQKEGIRVLPGAYLARTDHREVNPGEKYLRIALVHDLDKTEESLSKIQSILELYHMKKNENG